MRIRDYAERIYTGSTLKEKLVRAEHPVDDDPGPRWKGLAPPGRPKGLELGADDPRGRFAFPKLHELEQDARRGHALHFFANHELLALELMALVLLRFPEADPIFRKTLVSVMQDEQRHLSLYLQRMEELGVGFGEIGVNSFFFNHIADCASPMDFVARMSLTFEQANLDFSLHYARAFATVGDTVTQAIMEDVLQDEIGHVAHGVRWFSQWKDDDETLWDAYKKQLRMPLTPARAKGLGFFVEPRRKAGLPEDFIHRLRVYSHSKGRTPTLWLFNPDCEEQNAHPNGDYVPNKLVRAMHRDLEVLPMLVALKDDAVLVRREPEPGFLGALLDAGFSIPEFIEADLDAPRLPKKHPVVDRQVGGLRPWGWDPRIRRFLAPVLHGPTATWLDREHALTPLPFSKAWTARRYDSLCDGLHEIDPKLLALRPAPGVFDSIEGALCRVEELVSEGAQKVVVKAPWGTSGRRNIRLLPGEPTSKQRTWMERVIQPQGSIVIEPHFDRVLDLSYQFRVLPDGGFKGLGLTRTLTDESGRFRGVIVGRALDGLDGRVRDFAFRKGPTSDWIERALESIAQHAAAACSGAGYLGPVGVDAMIVRDGQELKLRPLVELNVRHTMGQLGLSLTGRLAPGSTGAWLFIGRSELVKGGMSSFESLVGALQAALPFESAAKPRIQLKRGVVATNEPNSAQQVLSVLLVSTSLAELRAAIASAGLADAYPL